MRVGFTKDLLLFKTGINLELTTKMPELSGFKRGSLPMKYHGVSLASGRLSDKEYKLLIDKITQRVIGWVVKKLSYAICMQYNLCYYLLLDFGVELLYNWRKL